MDALANTEISINRSRIVFSWCFFIVKNCIFEGIDYFDLGVSLSESLSEMMGFFYSKTIYIFIENY